MIPLSLLIPANHIKVAVFLGFMVVFLGGTAFSLVEAIDSDVHGDYRVYERVRLPRRRAPHSLRRARDMTQDDEGNWRRSGTGSYSGFRDCNAEPLIEGPL